MASRTLLSVVLLASSLVLGGCGDDDGSGGGEAPILDPPPAGAPDALAGGRLGCLGDNAPAPPTSTNLTLPGWVRTVADPDNSGEVQPSAFVEAFDPTGLSLGSGYSNNHDGRVAVTVPISDVGFEGEVVIEPMASFEGEYIEQHFFTSRPYTDTAVAAWVWLFTVEERDTMATDAGVTIEAGTGILSGAVHDCDVFGVDNAVIRWGERTDGVLYVEDFSPATGRTFTDTSGRFLVPNVPPGPITVEAYGRLEDGGPLVLLSAADVEVYADLVTAVDLQPRVGLER